MKPGEKPIDLTLQLAPLLPATTSELESSRYDAWDRSLRTKGVDIAGTLDWRGPVQNTPMEPHLEVPLFQGKTDSCHDGKLDGDEVLVDCGGSCSGGASTAFNLCSNQLDINGLQLNPIWEWQITHPEQTPDFLATCGADPSTCTNQPVLFDVIGPGTLVFPVPAAGVPLPDFATTCPRDPFSGHANWRIATFEGKIVWDTHDDPLMGDDDYNMYFVPDHKAALTSERSWLSLEFQAGETINGFSSPWWTAFHSAVDNPFPEQGHAASQILNGQYAIVTGLIGIDGVHGGYTESHPVFSLAILTGQTNAGAVVEENWSLFIRNWGNEGFCSQQQHYWDTSNGEYWIQLRWPEGATRVEVDVNNTHVFTNQAGLEPPAIWRGQGWLYLLFHLPTPEQKAYFDGDLTLRYSFPQGKAPTAPPLELAKTIKPAGAKPSVKEGFQVYVVQIADPQARARYQRVLQEWHAAQPPRAIVRIPVQLSSTVRTYEASEQRKASAPGRERAVTDQERAKHLEDLHKRMEVEFGKQVP